MHPTVTWPCQCAGAGNSASQPEEAWPTERHIILQSWGATARMAVQPPDWDDSAGVIERAQDEWGGLSG